MFVLCARVRVCVRACVLQIEQEGVDGGEMDMMWSGITLCASDAHLAFAQTINEAFKGTRPLNL